MYKFLNIHPKKKTVRDCVKRALSLAFNIDYKYIKILLNRLNREIKGKGFNDPKTYEKFIADRRGIKISFPAEKGKPRMNGFTFTKGYPKGRYILRMAGHLSTCIDGVVYDIFDCRHKCVYKAWKIEFENVEGIKDLL